MPQPTNAGPHDFVISITEEGLNASFLKRLRKKGQRVIDLCVVAKHDSQDPAPPITLDEFKLRSGGVDPFDIPNCTSADDPRVKAVTESRLLIGARLRIGLSEASTPELGNAVTLSPDAASALVKVFCTAVLVIRNNAFDDLAPAEMKLWTQSTHQPWYFSMRVSFETRHLDPSLDFAYFDQDTAETDRAKKLLSHGLTCTECLQQLVYDLDNAVLEAEPGLRRLSDHHPSERVLRESIMDSYLSHLKEEGPLIAAVFATPLDSNISFTYPGAISINPPSAHRSHESESGGSAVTKHLKRKIHLLCATEEHPLLETTPLNRSVAGMHPVDLPNNVSGITIDRNTVARLFSSQLLPLVRESCFSSWVELSSQTDSPVLKCTWHAGELQGPHVSIPSDKHSCAAALEHQVTVETGEHGSYTRPGVRSRSCCLATVRFVGTKVVVERRVSWAMTVLHSADTPGTHVGSVSYQTVDQFDLSISDGVLLATNSSHAASDDSRWRCQVQEEDFNDMTLAGLEDFGLKLKPAIQKSLQQITFAPMKLSAPPAVFMPHLESCRDQAVVFSDAEDLVILATAHEPDENTSFRDISSGSGSNLAGPLTLSASSELMLDYLPGKAADAGSKFQAAQTPDGQTLLFMLSKPGVLHLLHEESGSVTGWQLTDLTAPLIKDWTKAANAHVRTFDVNQSVVNGSISIAVVIETRTREDLFLASGAASGRALARGLKWRPASFYNGTSDRLHVSTRNIMFAETADKTEQLIVDVVPTRNTTNTVTRYHVSSKDQKDDIPLWVKQSLPVDVENNEYQSCVGRVSNAWVDGTYTMGKYAGSPRLVYVPMRNVDPSGPLMPNILSLPENKLPTAMTSVRMGSGSAESLRAGTDLYVIGDVTLYHFPANAQRQGVLPKAVLTNPILKGTRKIAAMIQSGVLTIWGKNGQDQLYYLSCHVANVDKTGSWTSPLPILFGVDNLSTYVNRVDGGNTIFASQGSKLIKLSQDRGRAAGLWSSQRIIYQQQTEHRQKPTSFKSNITTLSVRHGSGPAAMGATMLISTHSRVPAYINGSYQVLGPQPVAVKTDASGTVTVSQPTEDVNASALVVSVDGGKTSQTVSPADKAFEKLSRLQSVASLRDAKITVQDATLAGGVFGVPTYKSLLEQPVSDKEMVSMAEHMKSLHQAYSKVGSSRASSAVAYVQDGIFPSDFTATTEYSLYADFAPFISLGDLAQFLKGLGERVKDAVTAFARVVWNAAHSAWEYVCNIGGKIYRAILDTKDAIVGATVSLFNSVKTGIKNVIAYVQYGFEWNDIRRTKEVIHTISRLWFLEQHNSLHHTKRQFDNVIEGTIKSVKDWTKSLDLSGLGATAHMKASEMQHGHEGIAPPTPGSHLMQLHFQNNAKKLAVTGGDTVVDVHDGPIAVLLNAVKKEAKVLGAAFERLKSLLQSLGSKTLLQIIICLIEILSEAALRSTKVVVDAVFDVLSALGSHLVKILDTNIYIPIISDILESLHVPKLSLLDLFTWLAAILFTVPYKIANGHAPFADEAYVRQIIRAPSWNDMIPKTNPHQYLASDGQDPQSRLAQEAGGSELLHLSKEVKKPLYVVCHATAGAVRMMGTILNALEAAAPTGNPFGIPSAVSIVVAGCLQGAGDMLAPVYPLENEGIEWLSKAVLAAVILNELVFCGPVQHKLAAGPKLFGGLVVNDGRAVSAAINALLVLPGGVATIWHLQELARKPAGVNKAAAIIEEASTIARYVARITYTMAVNDKEPTSSLELVGAMAVANETSGILQVVGAMMPVEFE